MNIYLNGSIIEEQQAVVSVYDHGFLYGMGLFETFRTYGGKAFLLDRHLERLAEGCRELAIRYSPDEEELRGVIESLLQSNGLADAYFRLTVTAGADMLGLPSGDYEHPQIVIYVKPLPAPQRGLEREGKPLQLLELRRNTPEGGLRLKSLHYMNNILAKREMRRYPSSALGAEGLFLSREGYLAEGIVSNLFFLRGNGLYTPSLETGILPGITRRYVMELAAEAGLTVEEGLYRWSDLEQADEVFMTNSIQEIVHASRLMDTQGGVRNVGSGMAGLKTAELLSRYRRAAGRN
ncbi:aminodeoxychorismate lyase [Paenibacillus filicis]|uniref:Aminodeoxychorismate lyase n=1 Tax=Paenibacillus gyeongsangnamensis TaxID=3388067 RepID=A0ABT4QLB0_9BACL|nr:aminodeoxychorismate lyase [Paenibacillus filicis]MCZ8517597.1 aminodeoxychorismate lyase [Paenibacillus filicis]